MPSRIIFSALVLSLALGLSSVHGADTPPAQKVGFAERDASPAIGMECPGGYGKGFHRRFHDPCKVRAAVFDDGAKRVALVGIDALIVRRPLVESARKEIHQQCGIPPEAILIGASHSHSSGPTGMVLPGEYDDAPPLARSLAYEKSSCADPKYLELLHRQIVAAVCEADRNRTDSLCGVGVGIEDKISFNRRFRMKNGLTYTHPGKGNPDIVEPAGPIDPQVGVVGVWDTSGKLKGCVVNFACHGTTPAPGISANWIYWLEQTIRGTFAPDVVVVFLQGASGDVTQVNNLNPGRDPDGPVVGGRVGAEAVKVLLSMHRGALVPVDAKVKQLDFKRRVPSPERVEQCRQLVQKPPKEVGGTKWTFAKEIVLLDAIAKRQPAVRTEVQAIQVGPAVFLSNPAEFFCQLGLDIKAGSPFKFTFPVELANDCVGYVPTDEALGPKGGGYETRLTAYSNLEPSAGRKLVEAAVELSRQMKPGEPPAPSKGSAWRGAWDYGSVPPEFD